MFCFYSYTHTIIISCCWIEGAGWAHILLKGTRVPRAEQAQATLLEGTVLGCGVEAFQLLALGRWMWYLATQ
jgi:hypothetical protein